VDRYHIADLKSPPSPLFIYWDPALPSSLGEWMQAVDTWMLIAYSCHAVAHVNASTFAVEPGQAVLFPPSSRGAHSSWPEVSPHHRVVFGLSGGGERVALPLHTRPYDGWIGALDRAYHSMSLVNAHAQSFVWSLLWQISAPESAYRSRAELHEAEEFIRRNLSESFKVQDVASAVGLSERTLHRLFQAEHQASVAQFVRDRRVREAVRLLTTTDLPLKQVGLRIGVQTSQGFYCFIRDAVGVSPSEIRRRARTSDSGCAAQ
jgi:AraC-like DNA-binding protein